MDLVIDIQFCKGAKNIFIPKEVAVVTLEADQISHWIVLPPHSAKRLSQNIREENKWLCQSFHGIDWDEGFISKTNLIHQLRKITKHFEKVFVRGKEKKKFLEQIILNEIVNLEEQEDAPSFDNLPWNDSFCMIHATRMTHVAFTCALNNATRLKKWLLLQPKDLGKDEQFTDIQSFIKNF